MIITVNVFPLDHVNDLPEVEPSLVDENEEPKEEEEFEEEEEEFEEEEPQEEEEDMEVDIEEEENEPELIFFYVKADPLNPPPPAFDSESKDVVEAEDMVEPEDETVPNCVHEVEERATALENLVRKFGNAEERAECFLLCHDRIMPLKSRPLTQAAIERMITQRVNEALTADRARRVNASGAGGSGQGGTPAAHECTFARFMKCNPIVFHGIEGDVELRRWFEKTEMVFRISECAEGRKLSSLPLHCKDML
ncbi:hypothetical protein Tco_1562522 [Tanacetum coccineum]